MPRAGSGKLRFSRALSPFQIAGRVVGVVQDVPSLEDVTRSSFDPSFAWNAMKILLLKTVIEGALPIVIPLMEVAGLFQVTPSAD